MSDELLPWGWAFLAGTFMIIKILLVSILLTFVIGLAGSSAKLSGSRVLKALAEGYTVVFRGTPEFLVLLLIYFGSAVSLTALVRMVSPGTRFVDISPFWAGAVAISLIVGAAATETFRGAFLGVPRGQIEASSALGLSRFQTFLLIRLPQMWRLALPGVGNHLTSLIKDTSLVSIIGLEEIMFTAEIASSVTSQPFTMYFAVALIYLALTSMVGLMIHRLEDRAERPMRAT